MRVYETVHGSAIAIFDFEHSASLIELALACSGGYHTWNLVVEDACGMFQPQVTSRVRGQNAGKGILLMLIAMFLLIGMDALAKYLTLDYPVIQVLWARFFFHFVAMILIMGRRIPVIAVTLNPRFQVLRGVTVLLTNATMIAALSYIPLAETAALAAASPLFVALLSAPFLGERVGWRRMAGIVVGFAGVLLVVRPGAGVLHPAAFLAIVSALLYAVNQVIMRYLGGFDSALTTVFFTAVVGTLGTSILVPFDWVAPTLEGWAVMAAMGVLTLSGQYALVQAFAAAPAALVSPFNYSSLIWATLFGWLLFGQLPEDILTIAGSLVIVASGIAVLRSR
jgi:drug/metabolite transporter (DMT)-like permease